MTDVRLECGAESRRVRLEEGAARIDGTRLPYREVRRGGALAAVEIDGELFPVRVARQGDRVFVWCAGSVFEVRRAPAARTRSREGSVTHAGLVAPMPGRIRKTLVHPGEAVSKGQVVLVIEAMKMEHAIRAAQDGVVTRIAHGDGDLVEAGAVLAEITEIPTGG